MTDRHIARALVVLFDLAQHDIPADLTLVSRRLALSGPEAARLLDILEALDLVDSGRIRLTMRGLAIAARAKANPRILSVAA